MRDVSRRTLGDRRDATGLPYRTRTYISGRNVVLLGKAAVYCASARIDRLVLGTLGHNPFPDATPVFRAAMAHALSLGLAHTLSIDAPFSTESKAEVIKRGIRLGLPLHLTLSCMSPLRDVHCGTCSKCRERHDAFLEAGLPDTTGYANREYMGTVLVRQEPRPDREPGTKDQ